MTSYEKLSELTDISKIKAVYFNRKFKMDLTKTLELMEDTNLDEFSSEIEFYGDNFKIIKRDAEYNNDYTDSFEIIELKEPTQFEEIVPITLNTNEMRYSEEYEAVVPIITQSMIEEDENKQIRYAFERVKAHENKMYELETLAKELEELDTMNIEDFTIFEGGIFDNCAYIVVPEHPKHMCSRIITDELFLNKSDRNRFDYVAHAYLENGILKSGLPSFGEPNGDYLDDNYIETRKRILDKLVKSKQLVKIIGVSPDMLYNKNLSPKEFIELHLDEIKSYYK